MIREYQFGGAGASSLANLMWGLCSALSRSRPPGSCSWAPGVLAAAVIWPVGKGENSQLRSRIEGRPYWKIMGIRVKRDAHLWLCARIGTCLDVYSIHSGKDNDDISRHCRLPGKRREHCGLLCFINSHRRTQFPLRGNYTTAGHGFSLK